ncbi:hypothetical protein ISCGN_018687 [Ixodes scapularis]
MQISPLGKRRHVAVGIVNVSGFARAEEPSQTELVVKMKPLSPKCLEAQLALTLSCSLIREGKATDEDMQSIASLLSAAPLAAPDVGNLDDFEEDAETSLQLARLAAHCSELLQEEEEAEPGAVEEERKKATKRQRSPPIAVEEEEEEMPPEPPEDPESKSRRTADAEQEPTEDLLTWCQRVTAGYGGLKVTNLTTSWRNGMAFCALLHSFHPQLVDMDSLSPHDIAGNCKKAFDAASQLGVPRLLDPADMVLLTVPDKLVVATYLHQLRSHLTGRHATQCPAPPLLAPPAAPAPAETAPNDRPESPVPERPASPVKPTETLVKPKRADEPPPTVPAAPLMTRQQLMNPFDSDEEDSPDTKSRGEAVSEARPRSESRDEPPKRSLRATQSEGPVTRVIDLSPTREGGLPREANSLPDGFPSALVDPKKDVMLRLKHQIVDGTGSSPLDTKAILGLYLTKAFDNIIHDTVLDNLRALAVGKRTYEYIQNFLSGRKARLAVGGVESEDICLGRKGTPQGSVLSPYLFNVAMICLPAKLEKIAGLQHSIYADDITLWVTGGSEGYIEEVLQEAIWVVEDSCGKRLTIPNDIGTSSTITML